MKGSKTETYFFLVPLTTITVACPSIIAAMFLSVLARFAEAWEQREAETPEGISLWGIQMSTLVG